MLEVHQELPEGKIQFLSLVGFVVSTDLRSVRTSIVVFLGSGTFQDSLDSFPSNDSQKNIHKNCSCMIR